MAIEYADNNLVLSCLDEVRAYTVNLGGNLQHQDEIWLKERIASMLDGFLMMPLNERQKILKDGDGRESAYLLGIVRSMSEKAIRFKDPGRLRMALCALVAENFTRDSRESLQKLSMIYYCCVILDIPLGNVFAAVKDLCSDEAQRFIQSYIARGGSDLSSMGYRFEDGHFVQNR